MPLCRTVRGQLAAGRCPVTKGAWCRRLVGGPSGSLLARAPLCVASLPPACPACLARLPKQARAPDHRSLGPARGLPEPRSTRELIYLRPGLRCPGSQERRVAVLAGFRACQTPFPARPSELRRHRCSRALSPRGGLGAASPTPLPYLCPAGARHQDGSRSTFKADPQMPRTSLNYSLNKKSLFSAITDFNYRPFKCGSIVATPSLCKSRLR